MRRNKIGIKVHRDYWQEFEELPTRSLSKIQYMCVSFDKELGLRHYMVANSTGSYRVQQLADLETVLEVFPIGVYNDENENFINDLNTVYVYIQPEKDGTVSDMQMEKAGKLIKALCIRLELPQSNLLLDVTYDRKLSETFWQEIDKLNLE